MTYIIFKHFMELFMKINKYSNLNILTLSVASLFLSTLEVRSESDEKDACFRQTTEDKLKNRLTEITPNME